MSFLFVKYVLHLETRVEKVLTYKQKCLLLGGGWTQKQAVSQIGGVLPQLPYEHEPSRVSMRVLSESRSL